MVEIFQSRSQGGPEMSVDTHRSLSAQQSTITQRNPLRSSQYVTDYGRCSVAPRTVEEILRVSCAVFALHVKTRKNERGSSADGRSSALGTGGSLCMTHTRCREANVLVGTESSRRCVQGTCEDHRCHLLSDCAAVHLQLAQ